MNGYYSAPIIVRSGGTLAYLVELTVGVDVLVDEAIVYGQDGKEKRHYYIDTRTLIFVDKEDGICEIAFVCDNKEVTRQEVRPRDGFEDTKYGVINEEIERRLRFLVREEMENPKGNVAEIEHYTSMLKRTNTDKKAQEFVQTKIRRIVEGAALVPINDVENYTRHIYAALYGMGVLQELDDDPAVGEIMVNAAEYPQFHCDIYYIKDGKKYAYNKTFKSVTELENVFSRAVEFSGKELNAVEGSIIEATRSNKDRVNVLIPTASDNWVLNIRKFSNFIPNLDMMRKSGTVNEGIEDLMRVLVDGKANIGIGGPMGTGKTTFINFLLTYTKPMERKVVIASVSETDIDRVLKGHDIVILNVDDEKDFTFSKLIRASLRTTASRIIVPESRGGEFKQVYEANLKTRGNMFTAHALNDDAFVDMCVDMYMQGGQTVESSEYIKNKISKSLDIVIIMRKVGSAIRIKSISEVIVEDDKFKRVNKIYEWKYNSEDPLSGWYEKVGTLSDSIKKRMNEVGVKWSEMENL